MPAPAAKPQRKPRLLWANPFCLLDTSSGASMAVREMLIQLAKNGYEVMVIGATIFDAEKGTFKLRNHWKTIEEKHNEVIKVNDGVLHHHLVATKSIVRNQMTAQEEGTWYGLYTRALKEFKPDVVYYYGGQTLDMLIPDEAHSRGIPAVAYLANGNFQGTRWCRDVDLIITDSQATADMYRERQGFSPVPVGAFIDPAPVMAQNHKRKHLLLVNPSLQKGAGIVIRMAMMLEKRRPDITFEVVESRGNWHALVKQITGMEGEAREALDNVVVTPNTDDMRPIYGRARLLLAPSLCWESFGRVAAEAMMNGIPALVTNRGGLPEVIGNGGFKVNFPEECYEKPFTKVPSVQTLEPLVAQIERLYDDEAFYQQYVARAAEQGKQHRIETSTGRLMKALAPLVQKKAGDRVQSGSVRAQHKHAVSEKNHVEHLTGGQCLTHGRHGFFMFNRHDTYIGKSLEVYGEYCEHEVELLSRLLQPGQVFWDVGANVGGLSVPLAKVVGETGAGVAFEPQPHVFHMLSGNVSANSLQHVRCLPFALADLQKNITVPKVDYGKTGNFGMVSCSEDGSADDSFTVPATRGDDIDYVRWPDLIKIDVEGMELAVLNGIGNIIESKRPFIYLENDRIDRSKELIERLWDFGYKLYWHITPYFNKENTRGVTKNMWPNISSFNMLCVPREKDMKVELPEVTDSQHHPLRKREA